MMLFRADILTWKAALRMRSAHAASTSESLSREVRDSSVRNVAPWAGESRSSKMREKASAMSSALVDVYAF